MPQPLTDAINALTTYANSVTGASDQTLSDAVATLAAGYGGGGGGGLQLIDTITVTEATTSIDIQLAPYSSYNYLIFYIDCVLSKNDWIYINPNVSTPTTTPYTWIGTSAGKAVFNQVFTVGVIDTHDTKIYIRLTDRIFNSTNVTNLYLNTYSSNAVFNVGSEVRIYAIDDSNL